MSTMESNVSTIRIHMTTWLMDSQDIFRRKRSMLRTVEDFEANIGIVTCKAIDLSERIFQFVTVPDTDYF